MGDHNRTFILRSEDEANGFIKGIETANSGGLYVVGTTREDGQHHVHIQDDNYDGPPDISAP